jgi:Transketolase
MNEQEQWQELGQQLRVDSVRAAAAARSGHPTSSMSAADLIAVLLASICATTSTGLTMLVTTG